MSPRYFIFIVATYSSKTHLIFFLLSCYSVNRLNENIIILKVAFECRFVNQREWDEYAASAVIKLLNFSLSECRFRYECTSYSKNLEKIERDNNVMDNNCNNLCISTR